MNVLKSKKILTPLNPRYFNNFLNENNASCICSVCGGGVEFSVCHHMEQNSIVLFIPCN